MIRLMLHIICVLALFLSAGAIASDSPYLFVWAADDDSEDSDFVAIIDAKPQSDTYGDVLSTLPVGMPSIAHHSEHRMPNGGLLFVNGFRTGNSFLVDLNDPLAPSLVTHFTAIGDLSFPHSFERLPNGNVLATFQNGRDGKRVTGGLVELDPRGNPRRQASAASADFPEIRPYSLAVLPDKNLVVSTTTDMWGEQNADSIQFWALGDLSLRRTLRLPKGPRGSEHLWPAEPRLMADGSTLIVNTFHCGLYQVYDYATENPRIEHVYTFEINDEEGEKRLCALPVVTGAYWIQTVPARNGLVSIDLSDTDNPREVSYVDLGPGRLPHWTAIEPNEHRIVVTGYGEMRHSVMIVRLNPADGSLSIDRGFGDNGAVDFSRANWPHGTSGAAVPHGSVFSIP